MHWHLFWVALGGLLVGIAGRLVMHGRHRRLWPLGPLLGIGGALGGYALAVAVLGREHRTVSLVVAVVIAAIVVFGFSVLLRVRTLS